MDKYRDNFRDDPPLMDRSTKLKAAKLGALANPERIRLARETRGFTQREVLARLDGALSPAALSQLENGATTPTTASLVKLAGALDFPVGFFVKRDVAPSGYFRSLRSTPQKSRRQALAQTTIVHDLVVAIERHVQLPQFEPFEVAVGDRRPRESIEEVARQIREELKVGTGPVDDVVAAMEGRGIIAARLVLDRDDIDAFSVPFTDHPVVVLGDDKANTARSRFDAAHELGHLVMHVLDDAGEKVVEKEAHQFAAEFLMPAEVMVDVLPRRADWQHLLDLKIEWGVSMAALLMRAKTLGVMSDHAYLNAVKAASARGWRRSEPGDDQLGPLEHPQLLRDAVDLLATNNFSLKRLAEEADLPLQTVSDLVAAGDHRLRLT